MNHLILFILFRLQADESLSHDMERSPSVSMDDLQSKVNSLQTDLAEALETNKVYKEQLKG